MKRFERIITIVLDSVGIGEAPDAKSFNDQGQTRSGIFVLIGMEN